MGYDGHLTFDMNGVKKVALIEVKSGGASHPVKPLHKNGRGSQCANGNLRLFRGGGHGQHEIDQQKAGTFRPDYKYPKIQILTVEDLLVENNPSSLPPKSKHLNRLRKR
jgi:hypothetical protein